MPACGVRPEAIANAIARGSATRPTVTPATRSCRNVDRSYCRRAMTDAGSQREETVRMVLRLRLPPLPLQLSEHRPALREVVGEELARDAEQIADERAAQRVEGLGPLAPNGHDVLRAQRRELLRDDGLLEAEGVLQILHRALALDEALEDADARGMRERSKEFGFDRLQL